MRSKLKLAVVKSKQRFKKLSKNKQRITMVVTTLVFVAAGQIIISSFAATTTYSTIPAVAEMQKLTEEVVTLTDDYAATPTTIATKKGAKQANPAKATKKTALIAKVQARKNVYKKSIQYDPQTTANAYLPQATRDKLPVEVKGAIEQLKVIQGVWTTAIVTPSKDIKQKINEYFTYVTDAEESDTMLYGKDIPLIKSGEKVAVYGVVVDGSMALAIPSSLDPGTADPSIVRKFLPNKVEAQSIVDPICNATGPINAVYCREILDVVVDGKVFCEDRVRCRINDSDIDALTPVSENGTRKALVIQMRFSNEPVANRPIADIQEAFSINSNFYAQASYSQFAPSYEVYPETLTIDLDNIVNCDGDAMAEIHLASRRALNDNPDAKKKLFEGNFTDVVYAQRTLPGCESSNVNQGFPALGWAIFGSKGGKYIGYSHVPLADHPVNSNKDFEPRYIASIMAHEMGHGYGFGHAAAACNDGAPPDDELDISKYCKSEFQESALGRTIMGGADIGHDSYDFNVFHKMSVGWIKDEDVPRHESDSGTYTINALHKSDGNRAVRFKHDGKNYFIEYRPKTNLSYVIDKYDSDIDGRTENAGLLTYYADGRKTKLLGSTYEPAYTADRVNYNAVWHYNNAAKLEPYRIGEGEESICIVPSNATEDSIDVTILNANACPKDEITNYVYEKTINHSNVEINVSGVEIDKDGSMHMVDTQRKSVAKLDKDGKLLNSFTVPYDYLNPKIAINSKGEIYVSVSQTLGRYENKEMVIKFDQAGNELGKWDPGELRHISNSISGDKIADIVVDSRDNVYFIYRRRTNAAWSSYTQSIILKFNSDLSEEAKRWYLPERHIGTSLAVDKDDNIHAFEQGRYNGSLSGWNNLPENCVHKFSSSGNDLARWCKSNPDVTKTSLDYYNTSNDVFVAMDSMEVDRSSNHLMLPLSYGNNIAMYGAGQEYIGRIGSNLGTYRAIELAPDRKLYGATGNRVTHVFSPTAKPIQYELLRN